MNIPTPEEFEKQVREVVKEHKCDPEAQHIETDELMEKLLMQLGYEEAIKVIWTTERWYS